MHLQDKMEVGSKTSRILNKPSPYDQKREKEKMLSFYIATTKQLQRCLPLHNALLLSASCLHPVARTKSKGRIDHY